MQAKVDFRFRGESGHSKLTEFISANDPKRALNGGLRAGLRGPRRSL